MITRSNIHTAWRHRGRVAALVAAMAALSVATLGFASAAGAAGNASGLEKPLGASASTYLAGYQATPSVGLGSASVTFTVPAITCTATDIANGAEVGAGVYTDSRLTEAFVGAECSSSGPAYSSGVQTYTGDPSGGPVAAGDVVVASLFQSGTSAVAEIHDLTAHVSWISEGVLNGIDTDTVVDIGTSSLADRYPVPTFSKIKFTNATVNGDYLGFDSPTQYNTLNGGDLVIKASALTTSGTGSSFSDKFEAAS